MFKLYGYILNGDTCGTDLSLWHLEDLAGNPAFKLAESLPTGYEEINSIINLDRFGFGLDKDYIFIRDLIKGLVEEAGVAATLGTENDPSNIVSPAIDDAYLVGASPVGDFADREGQIAIYNGSGWDFTLQSFHGFDQLTTAEKTVCCVHKIGSHDQRTSVLNLDSVIGLGLKYHSNSVQARQIRAAYAVAEVHNRLPLQANTVLNQVISNANNMLVTYVNFGIEGTQYDSSWDYPATNTDGIMDFILGTGGFVGSGLIDSGYTPEGMTLQELCDKLEEYFIFGNY